MTRITARSRRATTGGSPRRASCPAAGSAECRPLVEVQARVERLQADPEDLGGLRLVALAQARACRRMIAFSASAMDVPMRDEDPLVRRTRPAASPPEAGGRCSGWISPSAQRMAARWTALRSSRTFPGQAYGAQQLERLVREAHDSSGVLARAIRCAGSARARSGDVARAGRAAAGRDGEDVEAEVEVLAELPASRRSSRSRFVARDDPHVDVGSRSSPPTRRNLPLLEHAQELALQVDGHLPDLVEEERAAVGLLEAAGARRDRAPVNAPFSWPKSSLSSRVAGIAAQLTATSGARGARAQAVDRAGDELLARAALAGDQHRGVGRRELLDQPVDLEHRRGRADQLLEPPAADHLAAQVQHLARMRRPLERRARRPSSGARDRPASPGSRRRRARVASTALSIVP